MIRITKIRKLLILLLALLLTASLAACAQPTQRFPREAPPPLPPPPPLTFDFETAAPTEGSGAEDDPWQLSLPEHLAWLADPKHPERLTGYYLLVNDITAPDNLVIAHISIYDFQDNETRASTGFRGSFDGGEHTITVNIYLPDQIFVGLFGQINESGRVQNLNIVGSITAREVVGGLAGLNDGEVTDSSSNVEVTGWFYVGGLMGWNANAVQNSYATGNVSGQRQVGGLIAHSFGTVQDSHATGNVNSEGSAGGLIGINGRDGEIIRSHASGDVESSGSHVGGLVGSSLGAGYGRIIDSHATGDVSGYRIVGGLVGFNSITVSIHNSYATGNVTGTRGAVGGLVGTSYGAITSSRASGNVTGGGSRVGGLVGTLPDGMVLDSFATGDVSGRMGNVGGSVDIGELIGRKADRSIVENSYGTGNVTIEGDDDA